jgi:hypothetical protein
MTEAEVRAVLAAWDALSIGGLEAWIAAQEWQEIPDGWIVTGRLQECCFDLEALADGVRIIASPVHGGAPTVWVVPA